jgi:hypothetical protein
MVQLVYSSACSRLHTPAPAANSILLLRCSRPQSTLQRQLIHIQHIQLAAVALAFSGLEFSWLQLQRHLIALAPAPGNATS